MGQFKVDCKTRLSEDGSQHSDPMSFPRFLLLILTQQCVYLVVNMTCHMSLLGISMNTYVCRKREQNGNHHCHRFSGIFVLQNIKSIRIQRTTKFHNELVTLPIGTEKKWSRQLFFCIAVASRSRPADSERRFACLDDVCVANQNVPSDPSSVVVGPLAQSSAPRHDASLDWSWFVPASRAEIRIMPFHGCAAPCNMDLCETKTHAQMQSTGTLVE